MPTIYVTDRKGIEHAVEATADRTLMETLRDEGWSDLSAICGGMMSCATCHVYADPAWLSRLLEQTKDERELVEESPVYQLNSRLSCQIPITDALEGLRVTIAPED